MLASFLLDHSRSCLEDLWEVRPLSMPFIALILANIEPLACLARVLYEEDAVLDSEGFHPKGAALAIHILGVGG